jgi:hypothetical protein
MVRSHPLSLTAVALLSAVLGACGTTAGPRPEDVPERIDLADETIPVLQVQLRATESGYSLVSSRRATGIPTLSFDLEREVVLTARDENGAVVAALSVPNPRSAHTTGARRPRTVVLPEGFLFVRLANPDTIQRLEISVRRGPNQDLRQSFVIDL